MSTLMQASHQWSSRPDDERFTSLPEMQEHFDRVREQSRALTVSSRKIELQPVPSDSKALMVVGPNGHAYAPTNHAFGQLASLAKSPGGYLRTLPAPLAADCINYGLQYKRDVEDVGVLLQQNGSNILRCATGPNYGRIWNSGIVRGLIQAVGDGVTGRFKVPGEFGKAVTVNKSNTTLYAGDRDMFVFLADEQNRIEIPNRRNGETGAMARGFFVWNSEVGDKTFGVATFLFDYVCMNRIVWGAAEYKQITIRHTVSAPDKWLEQMAPALTSYANSSATNVVKAIEAAKEKRIDNVDEWLAKRFSRGMAAQLQEVHKLEEGRPIETLFDAATAVTAKARGIVHQDARVELEKEGGKLLELAQ